MVEYEYYYDIQTCTSIYLGIGAQTGKVAARFDRRQIGCLPDIEADVCGTRPCLKT